MRKNISMILQLFMAIFLLFFSIAFLIIGRHLYGTDANLIWVGGAIAYIAISGIVNFVMYLVKLNKDAETRVDE